MFTLNLLATLMVGIYARNEQVVPHLNTYADSFFEKNELVQQLNSAAQVFARLRLPSASAWYSKSNAYSLVLALERWRGELSTDQMKKLRELLLTFAENTPGDYALAAREAVNNKRERILRDEYLEKIITEAVN